MRHWLLPGGPFGFPLANIVPVVNQFLRRLEAEQTSRVAFRPRRGSAVHPCRVVLGLDKILVQKHIASALKRNGKS
jgi:hypothetical protein